jgi:hypothetical protein
MLSKSVDLNARMDTFNPVRVSAMHTVQKIKLTNPKLCQEMRSETEGKTDGRICGDLPVAEAWW